MTTTAGGRASKRQSDFTSQGLGALASRRRRLVGRDCEIVEVNERIALTPLTTVTGPAGVGKTALALAVAAASEAQFPDGVFVVWLASLRSAEHVAGEVAAQVGLPRSGGQTYEDSLTHWLADRDVLLVLDNCEHVVSAVADLVEDLTARLPRLRVLATSREPLWVTDELSYRLAPLPVVGTDATRDEIDASPAVRLFRERAGARTQAALDTDRAGRLLGEICRRVDGLPLAIELAAARVVGIDLEDLSVHLDDLFDLLPQAARRADGGQRSLRATVEWSDALLSQQERRLLRRMAVFAGEFELAAINEICASDGQTPATIADLTARLVEKSLLLKQDDSGQYQLLETIRQFAVEQLDVVGELDAIRDRHARFYFRIASEEGRATTTGPERPHLEVLRRIEDNTRVALGTAPGDRSRRSAELAASLNFFWWSQGRMREGIGWLERARNAAVDAPAVLKAAGLYSEGFLVAHDTDDWHTAAALVDAGLAALGDVSEPPLILGMLHGLRGECDVFDGDARQRSFAPKRGSTSRPATRARGATSTACGTRLTRGSRSATRTPRWHCSPKRSSSTSAAGYGIGEMAGCNLMGEIWEARGVLDTARRFWERALQLRREVGVVAAPTLMASMHDRHVHGTMPTALLAVRAWPRSRATWTRRRSSYARAPARRGDARRRHGTADGRAPRGRRRGRAGAARHAPAGGWRLAHRLQRHQRPRARPERVLASPRARSRPGEFVSALALVGASSDEPIPSGDTGPLLDREALRQYRRRLAELDDELDAAAVHGDSAGQAQRSAERDALIAELKRATGLGGRPRRSGSPSEKARLNVTRTIRHAITDLSARVPELAAHLDESILTGVSCCYQPRVNIVWTT